MEDSKRSSEQGELDYQGQGRALHLRKHGATSVSTSFGNLPSEIILNILSKPPVKSVLRCRCVSKTWCNLIDDPSLIRMHMLNCVEKHSLVLLSYPIRYQRSTCPIGWQDKIRFFSLKDDGNILRASQNPIAEFVNAHDYYLSAINLGFLIFRNIRHKGQGQSFLFNPCRREVLLLPPATILASPGRGRALLEHYGFGFDRTTFTYKVVRIFSWNLQLDTQDYVAEVHTLGTFSWRRISSVFPYHVDTMPISAYGDIHWMINGVNPEGSAKSMIISFDFNTEEFKLTPHPDFHCKKYNHFRLVDLRGSLAILDLSPTTYMEIWVLKDYDRKYWAQEYRINIDLWSRDEELRCRLPDFRPSNIMVVGAWEEGLLFKIAMGYRFFYCNLRTGSLRYITCITPTAAASDTPVFSDDDSWIYSYTGSLLSLKNYGSFIETERGTGNCFDFTAAGKWRGSLFA